MEDRRRKTSKADTSVPRRPSASRADSSRETKPFSRTSSSQSIPICKFFLKGQCNRGGACSYLHPSGEAATPAAPNSAPKLAHLGHVSTSQGATHPLTSEIYADQTSSFLAPTPKSVLIKPHSLDKQASESWRLPGPSIDPADSINQGGSLSSPVLHLPASSVSLAPSWLGRRRAGAGTPSSSNLSAVPHSAPSSGTISPSSSSNSLDRPLSPRSAHLAWNSTSSHVSEISLSVPNPHLLSDGFSRSPMSNSKTSVITASTQSTGSSFSLVTTTKSSSESVSSSSASRESFQSRSSSSASNSSSHSSSRSSGSSSTPAPRISKRMNTGTILQQSYGHTTSQTDISAMGGSLSQLQRSGKKFPDKLSMMRWIQNFTGPGCDPSSILLQRADLEELLLQPSLPYSVIAELMRIFAHPEFREQGHTERVLQIVAESPLIRNPKNLKAYIIKLSGAHAPATAAYQDNLSNALDVISDIMERYPHFIEILGLDLLQISSAKIASSYPSHIFEACKSLIRRGKELLGSGDSPSTPDISTSSAPSSLAFSSSTRATIPSSSAFAELSHQLESLGEITADDSDEDNRDSGSQVSTEEDSEFSFGSDFRRLPLFPTIEEIMAGPKELSKRLSRNVVRGKYDSLNHYLDTHFRLLREDAITSIRDGIKAYRMEMEQSEATPPSARPKPSEVSFYQGVRLTGICPTFTGIVHRISFQVGSGSGKRKVEAQVDWRRSQRLLYGSLLCLSPDHFRTLIWATVANRDISLLNTAQEIDIKFTDDSSVALDPSQTYTMVESTSTYYEAYRHVLSALKSTNVHNFPFIDYLVRCKTDIDAPPYLKSQSSVYNMTNVFDDPAAHFDITAPEWPKLATTMDDSQLEAVKQSLTKELAIIQGPPGTGKTFVGLKVMRALLDNRNARGNASNGPILVICFTNHALDQFLEGILQFEPNIVRIGSRSKSEILKDKNLRALLQEMNMNTNEHSRARKQMLTALKDLQEDIEARFMDLCKPYLTSSDLLAAVSNDDADEDDDPHVSSLFGRNLLQDADTEAATIESWLGCTPTELLKQHAQKNEYSSHFAPHHPNAQFEADFPSLSSASKSNAPITPESLHFDTKEDNYFEEPLGDDEEEWVEPREDLFDASNFVLKMTRLPRESVISRSPNSNPDGDTLPRAIAECENVWRLPKPDRHRLYLYWLFRFRQNVVRPDLEDMCARYEHMCSQKQVLEQDAQIRLLMSSSVIGLTTTGVAKFQRLIRAVGPPIVVVEEAAEVLEAHIVSALTPSTKQLILIGDHEQLRPTTAVYRLALKYNLDVSLFERLISNRLPVLTLSRQRRMRPEISQLVASIYPHLTDHPDVQQYPNVSGLSQNVYFIDHTELESADMESMGMSKQNAHEAAFLARLASHLHFQGYQETQITILTAYSGQVKLIRQELRNRNIPNVYVTSVDNYQGQECDIICLSLVRNNAQGAIGFLNTSNRICVALSRARIGLYIMGNASLLNASGNPVWKFVLAKLTEAGRIGSRLKLNCQLHPSKSAEVASVADFDLHSSDGGCELLCPGSLGCGHPCPRFCHPYPHSQVLCTHPCDTVFQECGHRCPRRCFQECGPCEVPRLRTLSCGHDCTCPCSDDPPPCSQTVSHTLPCSHVVSVLCMHLNPDPATHKAPKALVCPQCVASASAPTI